jgi:O-antigen ligase
MVIPLALTISLRKRSLWRPLLFVATVAVVFPVTIWTASRSGQLVLVAVLAAYMLQRSGWKGLLAAAVLAGPVLLLGGRSGGEADESSMERLEAWSAGLHMFTSSPIWGIGKGQFTEHHIRTAHNTFMLVLAELGLVGLVLWIGMFYVALKIVVLATRRYQDRPDGEVAYQWARALLACLCGLAVGTSFLSLAYHPVVWAIMALPGAYYLAARRHDPEFRVAFGRRDLLAVTGLTLSYVVGVTGYLILRGVY